MEIELSNFCSTSGRADLGRVHSSAGIAFATDGKAMAWKRENAPDTKAAECTERALAIIKECESRWPDDGAFVPLPDLGEIDTEDCIECSGSGRDLVPCKECDGEGSRTCDLEHEHTCKKCGGRAWLPDDCCCTFCTECEGRGSQEKQTPMQIGPIFCDKFQLRKLKPYDGVEIVPVAEEFASVKASLLLFRIGQIRGILMPLCPDALGRGGK